MTFDASLAERVLAQIKDSPETWRQMDFAARTECGTAYCVAGWACVLSGLEADQAGLAAYGFADMLTDGREIGLAAMALLGLSRARAVRLFAANNDLDTIETLTKWFANNPDDDSLPVGF